jgi:hypothetical protein
MGFRGTPWVLLAALFLACSARSLQPGQDAGRLPDAGVTGDGAPISKDGGDPPPTSAWSVFATLGAPGLQKIWGTSDSDIWVVGSTFANVPGPVFEGTPVPSPLPRIVHYDGTGWRDVGVTGSAIPAEIWGRARDDIWTTGEVIRHFDGVSWRDVASPQGALPVWGASANDVWFGAGTQMLHWDGAAITAVSSPPVDTLLSAWGFSASDVWAGGGGGGLIHWDGKLWSSMPAGSTLYIYGLWGARPDDLWGVGNGGNRLHWNGRFVTPSEELWTWFYAVTGISAGDVWGVGDCCWQAGPNKAWVSHYDGVRWTDATVPGFQHLSGVWVSPSGFYYAVADGNTVLRTGPPGDIGGGSPRPGASAMCLTAHATLGTKMNAVVSDLQQDGGACSTILDCKLFVPTFACGDGYRLTGCPVLVSKLEPLHIPLDKVQAPECGSIAADSTCRADIYLDCPAPVAACQAGRCTSVAAP